MNDIFISYIIPCYNIQSYLPRCIDSLKNQVVPNMEVEFILVNDGSVDNTLSVIQQFAQEDDRVVVLNQENQGVCAARNNALSIARGIYVFFLDGDDFLSDDASEKFYYFCKDNLVDIVVAGNYKIYEDTGFVRSWGTPKKHIASGIYHKDQYVAQTKHLPVSCKFYRRDFLYANNIIFDKDLIVGEVYTFFIHSLTLAEKVGIMDDYVMYYLRRTVNSATSSLNVSKDTAILNTLHSIFGYVDTAYPILKQKKYFVAPVFFLATSFTILKYVSRTKFTPEIGSLITQIKKDKDYRDLLWYLTGRGFSFSRYTMLACAIRFLSPKMSYNLIRQYYRIASRNTQTLSE